MKTRFLFFLCIIIGFLIFDISLYAKISGLESYAKLLTTVARPNGIDWSNFGKDKKELLSQAQEWITNIDPEKLGNKNEQMAFWINAHNICVMSFVIDHIPIDNVMKIPGFRDKLRCVVGKQGYSLVEIESGIIRPRFKEPRIHFALWWAANGGPRLPSVPFQGKTINTTLEEQSKAAISRKDFVQILHKPYQEVKLSPLFDWYKYDFGPKDSDVIHFIRNRLSKEQAKAIPLRFSDMTFFSFDWSLDQANPDGS